MPAGTGWFSPRRSRQRPTERPNSTGSSATAIAENLPVPIPSPAPRGPAGFHPAEAANARLNTEPDRSRGARPTRKPACPLSRSSPTTPKSSLSPFLQVSPIGDRLVFTPPKPPTPDRTPNSTGSSATAIAENLPVPLSASPAPGDRLVFTPPKPPTLD